MSKGVKARQGLLGTALAIVLSAVSSGEVRADDQAGGVNNDPWEGWNRKVFVFNDTLDSYLLKPVAKGYRVITPDPLEDGVSNVFSNLLEIRNALNGALQWKWDSASHSGGRFLINTTVGIAGIFDVATLVGLEDVDGEDFGQTLAVWGVGSGPYVVIPLLGSSTLRDGISIPVDSQMGPIQYVDHVPTRNSLYGARIIDTRANLLDAEELVSGDRYSFIRDVYLQRRHYLINDGTVGDDFGGDYGDEYDDYGDEEF
jgi:phospholipid-binding lipoprotein MlaA